MPSRQAKKKVLPSIVHYAPFLRKSLSSGRPTLVPLLGALAGRISATRTVRNSESDARPRKVIS